MQYADWCARHDFRSPRDWMGMDCDDYRSRMPYAEMPRQTVKAWQSFRAEHGEWSLDEVYRALADGGTQ